MDDVIVYTSNPAIKALITLTESLSIRNLNISSGSLLVQAGAALNVISQVTVGEGATLTCSSNCRISNLINVYGNLVIDGGSMIIDGVANVYGGFKVLSGTLEILSLQIPSTTEIIPVISGGILKITGISNIDALVTVKGNAQVIVSSGTTTISNGIQCIENSTFVASLATINLLGSTDCTFNNLLTLGSKTILNIEGPIVNLLGGIKTALDSTSKIYIKASAILNVSGISLIQCPLNIDSISKLVINNGQLTLTSLLNTVADSLIELQTDSKLILQSTILIDLFSPISLDSTALLQIANGQKIRFLGDISSQLGSVIQILSGGNCIFPSELQPTISSDIVVFDNATLDIQGTISVLGNLNCYPKSILKISTTIGKLNLGGSDSLLKINLDLQGDSILNLLEGSKCTLLHLIQSSNTSKIFLENSAQLIIQTSTDLIKSLQLSGDSSVIFHGNTLLEDLTVIAVDVTSYPSLIFNDCQKCILQGTLDQFGHITLVNANLQIKSAVDVILNHNILCDKNSSIYIETLGSLSVFGTDGSDKSIIDTFLQVDGDIYLSGEVDLNGGIEIAPLSKCTFENALININANSTFNNLLSVTGNGQLNINANINLLDGIFVLSPSFPLVIDSTLDGIISVIIKGNSSVNSPLRCQSTCNINLEAQSYIELNGGLITTAPSTIHLLTSDILLGGNSLISGKVILELGSNIVSVGNCHFLQGIQSIYDKSTIDSMNINNPSTDDGTNNLWIQAGSCQLSGLTSTLTGGIGIKPESSLEINAPVLCFSGLRNSGHLLVNSIVNVSRSLISQTTSESRCVLSKGAQLIAYTINMSQGRLEGLGKLITQSSCTCGGIVDGVFDVVGDFRLLESSILNIGIATKANHNQVQCSARAYLSGTVEVKRINTSLSDLKVGDKIPILRSSFCEGQLSLSDSTESREFQLQNTSSTYNLIYQPSNLKSSKTVEEDSSSSTVFVNLILSVSLIAITLFI
ncbi:hypothetical protein DLAC_09843 [Tieghemostelium lacteum]|uniref:Uncharacterized protein n=1 Tax=Tieghemostelium lacteum TaxID=361077 RepID=A0A151Z7D0_TIELA|nr:hypothetical protein DLAC_09843 [Tieghemostelium lacteum]|eukprot:KYQ89869.1 hypothetical protein DLAC_09843 [Tieghemostelium lacteum]